jgi:hypothetical protein
LSSWKIIAACFGGPALLFLIVGSLPAAGGPPHGFGLSSITEFVHNNRDDINAYSTIVIAIFTAVLGVFTVSLAGSTRLAAQAAERALVDLERPWLFIVGATVIRFDPGYVAAPIPNNWRVKLHIKNIGRAPAAVDEIIYRIERKDVLPTYPVYKVTQNLSCPYTISADETIETGTTGPDMNDENRIDDPLVIYGMIRYHELNGRKHDSGFALEVSPTNRTHTPFGQDRYNFFT